MNFGIDGAEAARLIDRLTPREKDVARLMAFGVPQREVMVQLNIAVQTLDNHLIRVRKKLGVCSHGIARIWFAAEWHKDTIGSGAESV